MLLSCENFLVCFLVAVGPTRGGALLQQQPLQRATFSSPVVNKSVYSGQNKESLSLCMMDPTSAEEEHCENGISPFLAPVKTSNLVSSLLLPFLVLFSPLHVETASPLPHSTPSSGEVWPLPQLTLSYRPPSASAESIAVAPLMKIEQVPVAPKAIASDRLVRSEVRLMDLSNVVQEPLRNRILAEIARIEKETGTELQILVVDQVPPLSSPKRMATTLFNKWRLGSSTKNNGVLILVVLDERRTEIEVGKGLDNYMGESWCQSALRETSSPLFKQGNYGQGLLNTVVRVGQRLRQVDGSLAQGTRGTAKNSVAAFGVIAYFVYEATMDGKYPLREDCPSCGTTGRTNWDCAGAWETVLEATDQRPGRYERLCTCQTCGYQMEACREIPQYDGSYTDTDGTVSYYYDSSDSDSGGDSDGGGGGDSW